MSLTNSLVSLLKITDKNEMEQAVSKLSEKTAKSLLTVLLFTMNQQRLDGMRMEGFVMDLDGRYDV